MCVYISMQMLQTPSKTNFRVYLHASTPSSTHCDALQYTTAYCYTGFGRCLRHSCCSVLQCVAVCCSVLQCVAVCCSVLHCVAVCYSVLQCVAVYCSVLQCVTVCSNMDVANTVANTYQSQRLSMHEHAGTSFGTHCNTLQHTATHCNTLQHTATHCNALQRTATHCNTLQHPATHCNTNIPRTFWSQHLSMHACKHAYVCYTMLQCVAVAVCCSELQTSECVCVQAPLHALQHNAAHCNTM